MRYIAKGGSLYDEDGRQILVMLPTHCSRKRLNEICKILANTLDNIERGKEAAAEAKARRGER